MAVSALEGQAQFAEARDAGAGPAGRSIAQCGKKPSTSNWPDALPIDFHRDRAADQPAAAAEDGDRILALPGRLRPSSASLAVRQECQRATDCQGSSFTPFSAKRPAT